MSEKRGRVSRERGEEGTAVAAKVACLHYCLRKFRNYHQGGKIRQITSLRPSPTGIFDLLSLCETSPWPAPISGMTLPELAVNSCCTQHLPALAGQKHSGSSNCESKGGWQGKKMTAEELNTADLIKGEAEFVHL